MRKKSPNEDYEIRKLVVSYPGTRENQLFLSFLHSLFINVLLKYNNYNWVSQLILSKKIWRISFLRF